MQTSRSAAAEALYLALMLAALALSGCSFPSAIHTYECVTAYDRMSDEYDPQVSLVYVPQRTSLSKYRGIIVGDVAVGSVWIESPEEARAYARVLRLYLSSHLTRLAKFEYVGLDKGDGPSQPRKELGNTLLLEGMVTRFDMGSGFLRYLSGLLFFLQAGATDLQFEGRLTEANTGKLVIEFVDRRRHLANTPFGPNPLSLRNGYAMKVTARETASCLATFIGHAFDDLPATCATTGVGGDHEKTSKGTL